MCPIKQVPAVGPDYLLRAGSTARLDGVCLGAAPGRLAYNGTPLQVLTWSDTTIQFVCPSLSAGLGVLTVTRADGVSQGFRGFTVTP